MNTTPRKFYDGMAGMPAPGQIDKKLTPMAAHIEWLKKERKACYELCHDEQMACFDDAINHATALLEAEREYASQQAPASTPSVSAREDGWTEIKEGCNMPSDNEDCLVWTELATKWQASTFKNKKFYRYSNAVESDRMALYYFPDVVKWMPLPPPPSK